ncbi:hypothetical protein FJ692_14595 [Pseudomonas fluorescens]|nr:hypothetical protein C1751_00740 [Pseudomonas fluorescens]TPV56729.1 hypothetical protein FJ692_14595 [Pseudomonas fluorescens]
MGAGLPAMQATRSLSDTELILSQASQLPHFCRSKNQAISATTAANALAGSSAWLIGRPITR